MQLEVRRTENNKHLRKKNWNENIEKIYELKRDLSSQIFSIHLSHFPSVPLRRAHAINLQPSMQYVGRLKNR